MMGDEDESSSCSGRFRVKKFWLVARLMLSKGAFGILLSVIDLLY